MLTPKKDLREGLSLWTAYFKDPLKGEELKKDISVDVTIIGSGISAAFTAEELSGRGFSVAIFDRRAPMTGSTAATTALIQYELDVPLSHLGRDIGFDKAVQAWRRSRQSLIRLATKTKELGISCHLKEETSLYLSGDLLSPEGLEKERTEREKAGLQSDFITGKQIKNRFGLKGEAGLQSFESFSAEPLQMTAGFLRKSLERGARIFSPVDIKEISQDSRHISLCAGDGRNITAKFLVFCTGYEVPKQLTGQNYKILSTWAMASDPGAGSKPTPMIWQASDPYLYLRQTPDGRFICGGEDENFADEEERNALIHQKTKILEKKASRLMEREIKAEYAWCGSFGVTPTGMPLIGAVPGMRNTFAVLAFGGNGIVGSRIGAEIVGRALMGEEDSDASLYAFSDATENLSEKIHLRVPDAAVEMRR